MMACEHIRMNTLGQLPVVMFSFFCHPSKLCGNDLSFKCVHILFADCQTVLMRTEDRLF